MFLTSPQYFSFIGISQTLPATAYIKLNDIWMVFTMTYPFAEVALLTTKEVKNFQLEDDIWNKLLQVLKLNTNVSKKGRTNPEGLKY